MKLESASVEPLKRLHALNISGNVQMDLYDIREAFQVSVCPLPKLAASRRSGRGETECDTSLPLFAKSPKQHSHFPLSRLIHFPFRFFFVLVAKLLHQLDALSIADMGLIPYELLVPLGQLKQLNLSGNHLVNVSMQIIYPVNGLEVFSL